MASIFTRMKVHTVFTGIGYIRRKIACAFSNQVELRKTGDKQIRIISTGPKDYDHTVTLDEPTEKEDPFDNIVRVGMTLCAFLTFENMLGVCRSY